MKIEQDNYGGGTRWKLLVPLLPVALLPLSAIGFSLRPAVEYGGLARTLESAQERAIEAQSLESFMAGHGPVGPPTAQYRRSLAALASTLPTGFESADFYERCFTAMRNSDIELAAINIGGSNDLRSLVGALSIHERYATVQGRARLDRLPRFLAALHQCGQPVGVRQCKLDALEGDRELYDFQIQLAVYHLAPLTTDTAVDTDL